MVYRYVSIWIDKCDIWTIYKTLDLGCMACNIDIWYIVYIYNIPLFCSSWPKNETQKVEKYVVRIWCTWVVSLHKTSPFPTFLLPGSRDLSPREQLRKCSSVGKCSRRCGWLFIISVEDASYSCHHESLFNMDDHEKCGCKMIPTWSLT